MSDEPYLPRDDRDRVWRYVDVYQVIGGQFFRLPEPDAAFCDTLVNDDRPEAITGEYHAYGAAYRALHAAMDALAALVDITGDEA